MGIFNSLFGGQNDGDKKEEKGLPWISLTNLSQLETISKKSKEKTQIIFKHSTTCGISRMVLNMFTGSYSLEKGQADLYFIDLHANRNVSNEAGYKFQVLHQSPQLLIIKNEEAVFHASHGAIADADLTKWI